MEPFLVALYGHVVFARHEQVDLYTSYIAKVRTGSGTSIVGLWVPYRESIPLTAGMGDVPWVSLFTRKPTSRDPNLPLYPVGRIPHTARVPMWRAVRKTAKGKDYVCQTEEGEWTMNLRYSDRLRNFYDSINLIAALETNRATIRGP